MAEAIAPRPLLAPWVVRLFESQRLSPLGAGAALAGAILAVFFGIEWVLARLGSPLAGLDHAPLPQDIRTGTINAFLLAYVPTAQVYLARWTSRHLAEIRPLLGPQLVEPPPRRGHGELVAGVIGFVGFPLMMLTGPGMWDLYQTREYWIFVHIWHWITVPVMGWGIVRLGYAMVDDARLLSRLAGRIPRLDLLDLRPLSPFARQGLRGSLLAILYLSIGSLHLANADGGVPIAAVAVAVLGAALAALVLPVRGVHRRIRAEKDAALERVRREIRAEEKRLLEGQGESPRMPALLAFEARLASVREWPFDASTAGRFALYLAVGLGSWLGAAAVERLLDAALG